MKDKFAANFYNGGIFHVYNRQDSLTHLPLNMLVSKEKCWCQKYCSQEMTPFKKVSSLAH